MKYFAVFLPMKDEQKSQTYRPQHLSFLEKMSEEGKVHMYGRFVDGSGGLIVYRANDLSEVENYVQEDPYVKFGARGYEIKEWAVVEK